MLKNISNLGSTLNKNEQRLINGGSGYGTVTCEDGATFSASAESMDSVVSSGNRWCEDHGHGGGSTYFFVGGIE
ncbi:hypothetical protein P8625_06535 [Tenacibaculum tangerinum]|uniref:Bacteriocin n=1 Tax=Tenacibaculum tangerinum TaxID=3038772 RepID=A0ABY8L9F0_9FLAO|nr:hypothetical protein [Tenacibaculum tangerinum]WGH76798.1 hypothetical protein P8625_06535 [Tenacibaculum tangerinum]